MRVDAFLSNPHELLECYAISVVICHCLICVQRTELVDHFRSWKTAHPWFLLPLGLFSAAVLIFLIKFSLLMDLL